MSPLWFDAHLDLAYLAVNGRDMLAPLDRRAGPHPPAAVTLPALVGAGVRFALATIFTEASGTGREGYTPGDAEQARRAGRAQLEAYLTWRDRGVLALDLPAFLRPDGGVGELRAGMGVAEVMPEPLERRLRRADARARAIAHADSPPPLHAGILIECADPIRAPDELEWWVDRGVAAIGLTWARGSRYATGNNEPSCTSGVGLTELGRELVRRMDALGVVHDVSHLSDRALDDLLSATDRPVIASHSNCRALLELPPGSPRGPVNHRHLTDASIREIGRRGGVIGLNLVRNFIRPGLNRDDPADRPSIDEAIDHVVHVADLMGHRRGVGLGSDLDGGITAHDLPAGVDSPTDFAKLGDALAARGWNDNDVRGFAWRNWAEFFAGTPTRRG